MKFRSPLQRLRVPFITGLCALLLLSSLLLTACGKTLKETSHGVTDKSGSLTYHHASVVYEPVEVGSKHGKLQVNDKMTLELYEIKGLSPDEWLATEDMNVLYADGVHLPTLAEMQPTALQICSEAASLHVLRRLSDAALVNAVTDAWVHGTSLPYPGLTPQRTYKLRLESSLYPSLYYCVTYIEYATDLEIDGVNYGKYFLRSAFDGVFVPMSDAIHRLVAPAEEDSEEVTP